MEHIAALLLIVGCSGDLKDCNELPAPVTVFETYEACSSAVSPALADLRGRKPRILAECVYVDPAAEEEDAGLVWDIGRDGKLHAAVQFGDPVVAMNAAPASASRQ